MPMYYGIEAANRDEAGALLRERMGQNLASLRTMHGLSRDAVGKAIGSNGTSIANYENGITRMPFETAWALCDLFNVPLAVLGGRVSFEPNADPAA